MLIVLGGLPSTEKPRSRANWHASSALSSLRIDSIEQALRDYGVAGRSMDDAKYQAA